MHCAEHPYLKEKMPNIWCASLPRCCAKKWLFLTAETSVTLWKKGPSFDFWRDIWPSLFEALSAKSWLFCFLGFRDESSCVTPGPPAGASRCTWGICRIFGFPRRICFTAVSGRDQSCCCKLPASNQWWDITLSTRKRKKGPNLYSNSRKPLVSWRTAWRCVMGRKRFLQWVTAASQFLH